MGTTQERPDTPSDLGQWLAATEQRHADRGGSEALAAIRGAQAAIRSHDPDSKEASPLGDALLRLSEVLLTVGDREAATQAASHAVEVFRTQLHSETGADVFYQFVNALLGLAALLLQANQDVEAAGHAIQAERVAGHCVHAGEAAFGPDWARSLETMAICALRLGRPEDAVECGQQALEIRRALVAGDPDAWSDTLAPCLLNLAQALSALQRWEEAVAPAGEAIDLLRQQVGKGPEELRFNLAAALSNLGNYLAALGRTEDAAATAEEAVQVSRQLETRGSPENAHLFASALVNLSNRYRTTGEWEKSLRTLSEALVEARRLHESHPEVAQPALGHILGNLCNRFLERKDYAEALRLAEESVAIRKDLVVAHPEVHAADFAASMNSLGLCLSGLGRNEEAKATFEDAMERLLPHVEANPAASIAALRALEKNYRGQCLGQTRIDLLRRVSEVLSR